MRKPSTPGLDNLCFRQMGKTQSELLGERRVIKIQDNELRDAATDNCEAAITTFDEPVMQVSFGWMLVLEACPFNRGDFRPLNIEIAVNRKHGITVSEILFGCGEKGL